MPNLNFTTNLCKFLYNRISLITMRTLEILTCFFEDFLKESQSCNIVMFNSSHFLLISYELRFLEENVVAILADHFQDLDKMLKKSDMINGKVQFCMTKMANA